MRRLQWGVLAALLVSLAPASVWAEDAAYPAQWSLLDLTAPGCPDVSGTFINADRQTERGRTLSSWIYPKLDVAITAIRRLRLEGPHENAITLTVLDKDDSVLTTHKWQQGKDFQCEQGKVVLSLPGTNVLLFTTTSTAYLMRAADESLVIEQIEKGGGLVGWKPFFGKKRIWHLYERVAPPALPQESATQPNS